MNKIYIVNGSPRKNWNTYKMCESFAKGAESKDIETEIINLYDINFKGCRSCFNCKIKDGKNFSKCAYPDELTPILEKISQSDGLVIASPIYFGDVTGLTRCFIERLLFPFFQYKEGLPSTAPKKFPTAIIYTMNVTEDISNQMYNDMMGKIEGFFELAFSKPEKITAYDTCQFNDYSKYVCEIFDPVHKKQQLEEQLPKDIEKSYQAGVEMAEKILNKAE